MRRKKRSIDATGEAERDPFRAFAASAEAISARYQDVLLYLEDTALPEALKKSIVDELAAILAREVTALCERGVDIDQSSVERHETQLCLPMEAAQATAAAIVAQAQMGNVR